MFSQIRTILPGRRDAECFPISIYLQGSFSLAVMWLWSQNSDSSIITEHSAGWSLRRGTQDLSSCRCSMRSSPSLSLCSFFSCFVPWLHTNGAYVYMYVNIHQNRISLRAQDCRAKFRSKRWPAAHWGFQQRKPKSSPIVRVFNCSPHSSLISGPTGTPAILLPEHLRIKACGISSGVFLHYSH